MRIIAGRFRRRRVKANPGVTTRPIPDRVKQTLFDRFANQVSGRLVADIFAGTGTIGLECLSRGAESVVFMEKDRRACELLRENIAAIGVEAETFCWNVDVLNTSFLPKGVGIRYPYDLVFFDPPYRMVPDIAPRTRLYRSLERITGDAVTSTDAILVLRTARNAEWKLPARWQEFDRMILSSMELHLFRKTHITDHADSEPGTRIAIE